MCTHKHVCHLYRSFVQNYIQTCLHTNLVYLILNRISFQEPFYETDIPYKYHACLANIMNCYILFYRIWCIFTVSLNLGNQPAKFVPKFIRFHGIFFRKIQLNVISSFVFGEHTFMYVTHGATARKRNTLS